MTLAELQTIASRYGLTREDVREFGHLGHKKTWQAAIDEAIATLKAEASEVIEEAQPVATEVAEAVVTAATSEQAQTIYRAILTAALMVMVVIGLALVKVARKLWRRFEVIRDKWLLTQASYAALVLLLLKAG